MGDDTASASASHRSVANIVISKARLLSGSTIGDCYEDYESCKGGAVAVKAATRHFNGDNDEPLLVIPNGDIYSPLVHLHNTRLAANVLINYELGFNRTWTIPPSVVVENEQFADDGALWNFIYGLQEPSFVPLLSNVAPPTNNSWHQYTKAVHFDEETKLAVLYITPETFSLASSQVATVKRLLENIVKVNANNHCKMFDSFPTVHTAFSQTWTWSEWWYDDGRDIQNGDFSNISSFHFPFDSTDCYLSVVVYDDPTSPEHTRNFIQAITDPEQNDYPPALVVDVNGHLVETFPSPINYTDYTWVASYILDEDSYYQQRIHVQDDGKSIAKVELLSQDLTDLPESMKTPEYYKDIRMLRAYMEQSIQDGGGVFGLLSEEMPATLLLEDGTKPCQLGECEMGNLFTDNLRQHFHYDVFFLPSYLFQGPGWANQTAVYFPEFFQNFPHDVQICRGVMTGMSLFRLLDYSIGQAPFDSTPAGGKLLQLSGIRTEYDKDLPSPHRILSVTIWNNSTGSYEDLNRTKLYSFGTDDKTCHHYQGFSQLLSEDALVLPGEVPGRKFEVWTEPRQLVFEQMQEGKSNDKNYIVTPSLDGRMKQSPSNSRGPLNLVVSEGNCIKGETFWSLSSLDCLPCPDYVKLTFSKPSLDGNGQSLSNELITDEIVLTNDEDFDISIRPIVSSIAKDVQLETSIHSLHGSGYSAFGTLSRNGGSMAVKVSFDPSEAEPGVVVSNLIFEVQNEISSLGCLEKELTLDFYARLAPPEQYNSLGGIAAYGYAAAGVIVVTALCFAAWTRMNRQRSVVCAMQPIFLIAICFGVSLVGFSLIPSSIDDGNGMDRNMEATCMSSVWLLSIGFNFTTAAVFSKLRRVQLIFAQQRFRRVKITAKDVIWFSLTLVVLNVIFLLVWTIVDPLGWEISSVPGQPWNTYGRCSLDTGDVVGKVMCGCVVAVNGISLIAAMWAAFKARNISTEFSESKYLGIAVFSWLELCIVGIPVFLLIEPQNVTARYSLFVSLILAVCMSMLLVIFVPMMLPKTNEQRNTFVGGTHISGANFAMPTNSGDRAPTNSGDLLVKIPEQPEISPSPSSGDEESEFVTREESSGRTTDTNGEGKTSPTPATTQRLQSEMVFTDTSTVINA